MLVKRFELSGAAAASVQQAFAPSGAVESSVTVLGVVLLLVSTLTFTRGLQRMYEGSRSASRRSGMRNTPRALDWLVDHRRRVAALRPVVTEPFTAGCGRRSRSRSAPCSGW